MIDTTFENVLFESGPTNYDQAKDAASAADKNNRAAKKQAKGDQETADSVKELLTALNLKPGQTYRPDDIIAAIKKDPKVLNKIAANPAVQKDLGMSEADINALAQSPSLTQQAQDGSQSTQEGGQQNGQQNNGTAVEPQLGEMANDKNWQGVLQMLKSALNAGQAPAENNNGGQK